MLQQVLAETECADGPCRADRRHGGGVAIVAADEQEPLRRQGLGEFPLRPGHAGAVAQLFEMGLADIGDHAARGFEEFGQPGDLAESGAAHLVHEKLRVQGKVE